MAKIINKHPLDKKIDRVIYLLEYLLALELNRTNLDRNEIRARLGIGKAEVNKMLDGIKKVNLIPSTIKGTTTKNKKKK